MNNVSKRSMNDVLKDFKPSNPSDKAVSRERRGVTIWLSPEEKQRYDRLQESTRGSEKRFSAIARETLRLLIEQAEECAS